MVSFQDPPLVVDGLGATARLVDASVAMEPDELAAMAERDTVVLHGPLSDAVALARRVGDLGPAAVVEVEIVRGRRLDPAPFRDLAALGIAAGVLVVDPSPDGAGVEGCERDVDGWEIGALTWLIDNGVRTVRGVAERRVRRIVAVSDALASAVEASETGPSAGDVGSSEP